MRVHSERYYGKVGESGSGFETEVLSLGNNAKTHVAFKGGLGDTNSAAHYTMAKRVVEASEGEISASLIATTRPTNLIKVIRGNPALARQRRSQSVHGALKLLSADQQPEKLLLVGLSQGGITMLDSAAHQIDSKSDILPERTGVLTFATPSLFGPIDHDGSSIDGLLRLSLNCLPDALNIPLESRLKMWGSSIMKRSAFEPLYYTREVGYLMDLDMRDVVDRVRGEYPVKHVFYSQDVIPGAEHPSEHSTVFKGGHIRALTRQGLPEAVDRILDVSEHVI